MPPNVSHRALQPAQACHVPLPLPNVFWFEYGHHKLSYAPRSVWCDFRAFSRLVARHVICRPKYIGGWCARSLGSWGYSARRLSKPMLMDKNGNGNRGRVCHLSQAASRTEWRGVLAQTCGYCVSFAFRCRTLWIPSH